MLRMENISETYSNLDLNDEKDDGTEMVLKHSETIIVHPEEDEDQTDDQATDSDKPEDLEDLKHLETIYVDRSLNNQYYITDEQQKDVTLEEIKNGSITTNAKNRSDLKISSYYYDDKSPLIDIKDNHKSEIIGTPETENNEYEWTYYYMREQPKNMWSKRNQILRVLIIFLCALIILSASVSTVLFVKLKLNHQKQNKRRINDKLMGYEEGSEELL